MGNERECVTHFHTGHQLHAVAQTDIRPDVPGTAQQLHGFFCKTKLFFSLKTPYTQSKLRIITKELKESPENGYRDVRFPLYSTQTIFVEMSLFLLKGFAGSLRHEGYHHHHRLHQGDTQRGAQAGAAGENTNIL